MNPQSNRRAQGAYGECVAWRSSKRAWLGGHSAALCLMAMVDEASGRALARFAAENSTPENFRLLEMYLRNFGRPLSFRTPRLSLYRGNPRNGGGSGEAGHSQIRRALAELDIEWRGADPASPADSASRFFAHAKRELKRGLVQAGARTIAEANRYLERTYLPAWNSHMASPPPACNAHRPLLAPHDLNAILSEVERRAVSAQRTIQFHGATYALPDPRKAPLAAGSHVDVEERRDGSVFLRFGASRFALELATPAPAQPEIKASPHPRKPHGRAFNPHWMDNFFKRPAAPLWRLLK